MHNSGRDGRPHNGAGFTVRMAARSGSPTGAPAPARGQTRPVRLIHAFADAASPDGTEWVQRGASDELGSVAGKQPAGVSTTTPDSSDW